MKTLKIAIGKTYNLGNYQSLRLDVGLETDEEGRLFVDLYDEAQSYLKVLEKANGVKLQT